MKKKCKIEGCELVHMAKGYCTKHYYRNKRNGSPYKMRKEIHGNRDTPEYRSWAHIKDRCLNPNNKRYKHYGGRGITVCDRWINSFSNFYNDMGDKPNSKMSIDRIDNDGNYTPGNCKWSNSTEQVMNKRSGKTKSVYKVVRWNNKINKWTVYFRNKYVGVSTCMEKAISMKMLVEKEYLKTIS